MAVRNNISLGDVGDTFRANVHWGILVLCAKHLCADQRPTAKTPLVEKILVDPRFFCNYVPDLPSLLPDVKLKNRVAAVDSTVLNIVGNVAFIGWG